MNESGATAWWSEDPEFRGASYERVVLDAEGIAQPEFHVKRWAAAYRRLSDQLIHQEGAGRPSGALLAGTDADMVWRLVYGYRTWEALRFVLGPEAFEGRSVVEVGAGWGPAAWAAAWAGGAAVGVVESEPAARARGRRLWEVAPLRPQAPSDEARWTHVLFPYALREMAGAGDESVARAVRLLQPWAERLERGGTLTVLEPGTRTSGDWLGAVRDLWLQSGGSVRRPCTHAGSCPALRASTDWCHFTTRIHPGRWTATVAHEAGRRSQELHVAYLVLQPTPSPVMSPPTARVLERRGGKGKDQLLVCDGPALRKLTALHRDRALRARVQTLSSGDCVELDSARLELRGDGERLSGPDAIKLCGHAHQP